MEPRREEHQKSGEQRPEEKPKRFRLVKLEERIAPKKSASGKHCGHGTWPGSLTCSIE